ERRIRKRVEHETSGSVLHLGDFGYRDNVSGPDIFPQVFSYQCISLNLLRAPCGCDFYFSAGYSTCDYSGSRNALGDQEIRGSSRSLSSWKEWSAPHQLLGDMVPSLSRGISLARVPWPTAGHATCRRSAAFGYHLGGSENRRRAELL